MERTRPQDPKQTAEHVVATDLDYMTRQAGVELARKSGRHLAIAGAAGLLGHCLVQSSPRWNRRHPAGLAACGLG